MRKYWFVLHSSGLVPVHLCATLALAVYANRLYTCKLQHNTRHFISAVQHEHFPQQWSYVSSCESKSERHLAMETLPHTLPVSIEADFSG